MKKSCHWIRASCSGLSCELRGRVFMGIGSAETALLAIVFWWGCLALQVAVILVGDSSATHGNLTVMHIPRVGIFTWHHAFDLSILKSRWEVSHLFLLILTIILCPGVGILIISFRKCQNPHPMPDPSPLGLDIDRCITSWLLRESTLVSGS